MLVSRDFEHGESGSIDCKITACWRNLTVLQTLYRYVDDVMLYAENLPILMKMLMLILSISEFVCVVRMWMLPKQWFWRPIVRPHLLVAGEYIEFFHAGSKPKYLRFFDTTFSFFLFVWHHLPGIPSVGGLINEKTQLKQDPWQRKNIEIHEPLPAEAPICESLTRAGCASSLTPKAISWNV